MILAGFVIYMLKTALFLSGLYILYHFGLAEDKSFFRNRIFLISATVLSFILPSIPLTNEFTPALINLGEIIVQPGFHGVAGSEESKMPLLFASGYAPFAFLYITGLAFSSILLFIRLLSLLRQISGSTTYSPGIYLLNNKALSSFSAFGKVFISARDLNDLNTVLLHEKSHKKHHHFADLLFIEIISLFQWFNPFVYMLNRSLRMVHEYQADNDCIILGVDPGVYSETLLLKTFSSRRQVPASAFSQYSLLKNRFKMMKNNQPSKLASLKMVLALPVILSVFLISSSMGLFTKPEVRALPLPEAMSTLSNTPVPDSVFAVPEVMPVFQDGDISTFRTWVMSNVKYPREAAKSGIQGKVYLKFIVDTEGKVSDVEIVKSASPLLDDEALRVVGSSPAWTPGKNKGEPVRVSFAIAVNFALN